MLLSIVDDQPLQGRRAMIADLLGMPDATGGEAFDILR